MNEILHKLNIQKPALLLDQERCRKNIRNMAMRAKIHNLEFRPHFKTHQSLSIGRWFKDAGVKKITVSSVEMAEYFSSEWSDITIAFPVNILETTRINKLASSIKLNLLVESEETASFLATRLEHKTGVFLKIDTGYHRTGIAPDDYKKIESILNITQNSSKKYKPQGKGVLNFKGFLTHAGHSYNCRNKAGIQDVHASSISILSDLKQKYSASFPYIINSIGDTPSCSVADNFSGIDEIRPGNFVFYDLMQVQTGSCNTDQIAVAMACPVVAVHEHRNEIVIYGGGVHFSKEKLDDQAEGRVFGRLVKINESGFGELIPGAFLKSLSQEHGIISAPEEFTHNIKPGNLLVVLPVHSCMTANLMKNYTIINP